MKKLMPNAGEFVFIGGTWLFGGPNFNKTLLSLSGSLVHKTEACGHIPCSPENKI